MDTNNIEGSTILLVEDEETLAIGLEYNLVEEGYHVLRASDGRQALTLFDSQNVDLVILDIMLPYVDGFEIAEKIRLASDRVPILMLTARTRPADRIRGLETGADDYLTKPFHLKELLLRVQGMLRRKAWYRTNLEGMGPYTVGRSRIDFATYTCETGKKKIKLTVLEAALIRYFVEHAGEVVSREDLLENVWKTTSDIETRTVDNFIARIRKYIEPKPAKPVYLQNVRGVGYIFIPDEKKEKK